MKASCHRQRHSRRTAAQHVTFSDPFPLAQWQGNSSRNSSLVARTALPHTALPHALAPMKNARDLRPSALCIANVGRDSF